MWFKKKKTVGELRFIVKEKKIAELVDVMLSSDLELHTAPLSDEYYILDRRNEIYIWLTLSSIKIANHDFRYEVSLSGAEVDLLIKKVKKKIQSNSDSIKAELFKNEVGLIDKIKNLYIKE